jgi:hypothetical protein
MTRFLHEDLIGVPGVNDRKGMVRGKQYKDKYLENLKNTVTFSSPDQSSG